MSEELQHILTLTNQLTLRSEGTNLSYIIEMNEGKTKTELAQHKEATSYFEIKNLKKRILRENDESIAAKHHKMIKLLSFIFQFNEKEHYQMMDMSLFQEIVTVPGLDVVFSQTKFINFTINETEPNFLLELQSYYLSIFLQVHMEKDMRYKAAINSASLDTDNPFTRNVIREENQKDPVVGEKYMEQLKIEEKCLKLLSNFFPDIQGIWCDHNQFLPFAILRFVRGAFEYGFISVGTAKKILKQLRAVTASLLKLETAWLSKLSNVVTLSAMIKANHVTLLFSKCREEMAYIIMQILVLLSDHHFVLKFPGLLDTLNAAYERYPDKEDREHKMKKKVVELEKDFKKQFLFYDQQLNDTVLFVVMNYLSNNVTISLQTSETASSIAAVERVFLFITTSYNDCFLNSIKHANYQDLKFFQTTNPLSEKTKEKADEFGYALRKLLELIGQGVFDKETGAMTKDFEKDEVYQKYLHQHIPSESPSLAGIVGVFLYYTEESINSDSEFQSGFTKESVPLGLLALADYISSHFGPSVSIVNKTIFDALQLMLNNNNYCKAQIFKGDGLFHLKRIVERMDPEVFTFLFHISAESNIAFFIDRSFITLILEKFEILCQSLMNSRPETMNIQDGLKFLLLCKMLTRFFKKTFLNDREKLQVSLLAQQSIYLEFTKYYLPTLLEYLTEPSFMTEPENSANISRKLYSDGFEADLIKILEKKTLTIDDKKNLILQICFNLLKTFNMACIESYSYIVLKTLDPQIEPVKSYFLRDRVQSSLSQEPIGLECELLIFLRLFKAYPQDHILIENPINFSPPTKDILYEPFYLLLESFKKVTAFADCASSRLDGQTFLFDGLFPLMYKISKAIKNLTNFDKNALLVLNSGKIKKLLEHFSHYRSSFNKIIFDRETHQNVDLEIQAGPLLVQQKVQKIAALANTEVFKEVKAGINHANSNLDLDIMVSCCEEVERILKAYYEEFEQGYAEKFATFQDLTEEEFHTLYSSVQKEKPPPLPELQRKKEILNLYVRMYQTEKETYFERAEEPNIMGYFDKDSDNLQGIFNSCNDRFLEFSKKDKRRETEKKMSSDYAMFRFWTNPSCFAYINMIARLLKSSKTARKEFYTYINSDKDKVVEEAEGSKANFGLNRYKTSLLTNLLRINLDLIINLNQNSSTQYRWWINHQNYDLLQSFFKNLCECNFMQFKEFVGTFTPRQSKDTIEWGKLGKSTMMSIFVKKFMYLTDSCRLTKNKDPEPVHSDQLQKMQPLMSPLIDVINEAITGPCYTNQKILVKDKQLEGPINICIRLIDRMESNYHELGASCIELLLTLCEGYDPKVLAILSQKIPAPVIANRISRIAKKIYVKQLIESGEFRAHAKKTKKEEDQAKKQKMGRGMSLDFLEATDKTYSHTIDEEVDEVLKKQNPNEDKFLITEDMESMVRIKRWRDLFDLYMTNSDFSESMQFNFLFKLMVMWRILASESKSHKNRIEEAIQESTVHFESSSAALKEMLEDPTKGVQHLVESLKHAEPDEFTNIFYFLHEKIMTEIEIVDPAKKPLLIYFPKSPACFMLSEEAKRAYREECEITDSNTKMLNLMRNFKMFQVFMNKNLKIWRLIGFFFRFLSEGAFKVYTLYCWVLGLLLNIVMMASIVIDEERKDFQYRNKHWDNLVLLMAYLLVFTASIFLIIWLLFKYPPTVSTEYQSYLFEHQGTKRKWLAMIYVAIFPALLQQAYPMNFLLHIIFSVVGREKATLVLALNLLLVINISKTTKFVITSFLLHLDQLLLTLMLAIFLIFSYTVLLGNVFINQISEDGNEPCDTLLHCFLFTVNLGLRNGGGIAESMTDIDSRKKYALRNVYDVTFFLFINVISLNIIFGIIIDTFAQLRDDQNVRGTLCSPSYRLAQQLFRVWKHQI